MMKNGVLLAAILGFLSMAGMALWQQSTIKKLIGEIEAGKAQISIQQITLGKCLERIEFIKKDRARDEKFNAVPDVSLPLVVPPKWMLDER